MLLSFIKEQNSVQAGIYQFHGTINSCYARKIAACGLSAFPRLVVHGECAIARWGSVRYIWRAEPAEDNNHALRWVPDKEFASLRPQPAY